MPKDLPTHTSHQTKGLVEYAIWSLEDPTNAILFYLLYV